jgi:hypothetical protein
MERIEIQTPLGLVTLEHRGVGITATGDELPLDWWTGQTDSILYGGHGHVFYPNDCDICDVLIAAASAVGEENVTASLKAHAQAAAQLKTPTGVKP